jgi:flagellar protein FliS
MDVLELPAGVPITQITSTKDHSMFTSVSSRSASAYRKVSVETNVGQASAHALVDMLFDGLLLAVGSARVAIKNSDVAGKCKYISNAVRILEEGLKLGLNLKDGGELAANLNGLYGYCVQRLTEANLRSDDAALAEVIRLIEPVAGGWKQIGANATPQLMAA